jgi:hypothetical protein
MQGCSSADASLDVLLEREETIASGLSPGADVENIRDGWAVTFTEFVVSLGPVRLTRGSSSVEEGEGGLLVDLVTLEGTDADWLTVSGLEAARYDFGFSLVRANAKTAVRGVSPETRQEMLEAGYTSLVRGTLRKKGGVSCPPPERVVTTRGGDAVNAKGVPCFDNPSIDFEVVLAKEVLAGPCELDGMPGVGLASGAAQSVAVTFHGDHIFFNGFPQGEEATVFRLAQWLADSDLDLDGRVTLAELRALAPSELSEFDERYSFAHAPLRVDSLLDLAQAQLISQGHFQGEGECPMALRGD